MIIKKPGVYIAITVIVAAVLAVGIHFREPSAVAPLLSRGEPDCSDLKPYARLIDSPNSPYSKDILRLGYCGEKDAIPALAELLDRHKKASMKIVGQSVDTRIYDASGTPRWNRNHHPNLGIALRLLAFSNKTADQDAAVAATLFLLGQDTMLQKIGAQMSSGAIRRDAYIRAAGWTRDPRFAAFLVPILYERHSQDFRKLSDMPELPTDPNDCGRDARIAATAMGEIYPEALRQLGGSTVPSCKKWIRWWESKKDRLH